MNARNILPWAALLGSLSSPAAPGAVIETDRERSVACVACHGALGVSEHASWPHLAGQNPDYLVKQLRDFRAGTRRDPWMSPMAAMLSDDDIADLAAWFASITAPERSPAAAVPVPPQVGPCIACHGEDGRIADPASPNLAGQNRGYLAAQLRRFRAGQRAAPAMAESVRTLSDADIETLAEYYSRR